MRFAVAADQAAVEELVREAYQPWVGVIGMRPIPMEADYGDLIAARRVHVTGPGPDGVIVLLPEDGVLLVENVAVRPGLHGRGIGRSLLAFAETEARRLDLPALRLYTHVKMTRNIAIYESLGYVETGREEIDGRSALMMRKELTR